jgi:hypothetical protein
MKNRIKDNRFSDYSLLQNVQAFSEAHPASYSMGTMYKVAVT